jgi:hypothetical protein
VRDRLSLRCRGSGKFVSVAEGLPKANLAGGIDMRCGVWQ